MWGGGSTLFGFFRTVARWVRGRGLGVYLGVTGGEWSITGDCSLWGQVFLWVGLRIYLCVLVAAIALRTVCSSGGVGKVMYEVGNVFV